MSEWDVIETIDTKLTENESVAFAVIVFVALPVLALAAGIERLKQVIR